MSTLIDLKFSDSILTFSGVVWLPNKASPLIFRWAHICAGPVSFATTKELSFIKEDSLARVYPNEKLFSHVIGQIDDNNNGISGIEKTYDYELRTSKDPLKLTLDTDIQYLIREELFKSKDIFF